jgi:hypothetical protein
MRRVVEAQRRVAPPIRPHLAPQPVQLGDGDPKLSERDPCVHYLSLGTNDSRTGRFGPTTRRGPGPGVPAGSCGSVAAWRRAPRSAGSRLATAGISSSKTVVPSGRHRQPRQADHGPHWVGRRGVHRQLRRVDHGAHGAAATTTAMAAAVRTREERRGVLRPSRTRMPATGIRRLRRDDD